MPQRFSVDWCIIRFLRILNASNAFDKAMYEGISMNSVIFCSFPMPRRFYVKRCMTHVLNASEVFKDWCMHEGLFSSSDVSPRFHMP